MATWVKFDVSTINLDDRDGDGKWITQPISTYFHDIIEILYGVQTHTLNYIRNNKITSKNQIYVDLKNRLKIFFDRLPIHESKWYFFVNYDTCYSSEFNIAYYTNTVVEQKWLNIFEIELGEFMPIKVKNQLNDLTDNIFNQYNIDSYNSNPNDCDDYDYNDNDYNDDVDYINQDYDY